MITTRTENRYYAKAADIPPEMLAAPPPDQANYVGRSQLPPTNGL
jgi:hypothetical protein